MPLSEHEHHVLRHQRHELLLHISEMLDRPMIVLSIVWLVLMIVDYTSGLSPLLSDVRYALWALFVLHFAIEFIVAPATLDYLRHHWLTALALVLPAFRILRAVRIVSLLVGHAGGSLNLVRVVTTLNRGLQASRSGLGHRGVNNVAAFSLMVVLAGAAGMYQFESPAALRQAGLTSVVAQGGGLHNYSDSVWFTGMILTTIGSDYFPQTPYGRLLCFLLAVYGLSVFGYITAAVASYFVGKESANAGSQSTGSGQQPETQALHDEILRLQAQIGTLIQRLDNAAAGRQTET